MKKKIIFLDIDGTILSYNQKLSSKVKYAIEKARENGHYVFLCTGRNYANVKSLIDIKFDGFICSNGGYVIIKNQVIYESSIPEDDLDNIVKFLDENKIEYNIETNFASFYSQSMIDFFEQYTKSEISELNRLKADTVTHIHQIKDYYEHKIPVQCVLFLCQNERHIKQMKEKLSKDCYLITHGIYQDYYNIEVNHVNATKGKGIKKVIEKLNVSIEDTICFGDGMNDYDMMKTCHHSVAMGNACEEIKHYASIVCESVDDDGVYYELKRLELI